MLNLLNSLLRRLGVLIISTRWLQESLESRWSMNKVLERIREYDVAPNTVVDLGAAQGGWTKLAMETFPHSRFLMVEPLRERAEKLENLCEQHHNVFFANCVAGEEQGEVTFSVAP